MMRETIAKVAAITVMALVIQATFAGDRSDGRADGRGPVHISVDRSDGRAGVSTAMPSRTIDRDQLSRPRVPSNAGEW